MLSSVGSGLTVFVLSVYVFQQTREANSVAMVILAGFLPSVILKPLGGVLADRYNRKIMMIIGDLGAAFGVFLIIAFLHFAPSAYWSIYLGIAVSSVFASLHNPAYKALVTDLLSAEQYAKAAGLMQLTAASQYLVSPVIAGMLMAIAEVSVVLFLDVLSFVAAILTVMATGKVMQNANPIQSDWDLASELRDGWRALAAHPGVLLLVGVISLVSFCIGFLQVLLGPVVLSFTNEKTLGVMQSVSALGMLAGSLYIGTLGKMNRYSVVLFVSLGLSGVFFSLTGLTTNVYFIVTVSFLFFCTLPFINTSADVLIRTNIANDSQGRAWGLIGTISQLGYILAYASAGLMADYFFTPLLLADGLLSKTVGVVIGVGPGRGMGLMLSLFGLLMLLIAAVTYSNKTIHRLG